MMSPRWRLASLAAVAVVIAAGCSAPESEARSTQQVAEETITGVLADELDVGALSARCPEISSPAINTTFLCMATTDDEQVVRVEATIVQSGRIELATENVVRAEALDWFETRAVADLNGATGSQLVDADLECGNRTIILDSSQQMVCGVNNNDAIYDITFTVNDIENTQFDLEVAELPRA